MKSKILILIFIIFMMCGCTAEVNLEITKDKINESTSITAYENVIYTKDILRTSFRNYIPIYASDVIVDTMPDEASPGVTYYEKEEQDLGNGYIFTYKYNFDIDEYKNARTIKDGFNSYNVSFNKRTETLSLSTDNDGLIYFEDYPLLEEVRINIKTDYEVLENNADRVDNNTYTWIFTKDSNKNINMVVNMDDTPNNILRLDNTDIIVIVSIIGIIFVICLILIIKNVRNNKL